MSVGLLIITHNRIGEQLLETATVMLETSPLECTALDIHSDCDLDYSLQQARLAKNKLDSGDGVLVLADMYGSTPSNIANKLATDNSVIVITGINLPMLVRVLNYPRLNLEQLAEKARSGGSDGIMVCREQC